MGKKKRGHPDVEEILARPWCYYCERDFDDLKILISHQKAKHFKCERCGRRLNTAGGLSVHMTQVHKESLAAVDNALPNRAGLDVEIFGMEGIPEDIVQSHNQRVLTQFHQAEAERRAATGNPAPGGGGSGSQTKKPKFGSPSDLKKRLAEHKAKLAAEQAAGASSGSATPVGAGQAVQSPGMGQSPGGFAGSPQYPPHQQPFNGAAGNPSINYPPPYGQPGAPFQQPPSAFPPQPGFASPSYQQYPPGGQQFSNPQFSPPGGQTFPPQYHGGSQGGPPRMFGANSPPLPFQPQQQQPPRIHTPPQNGSFLPRPPSLPAAPGLPQRPAFGAPQVNAFQMQQMHHGQIPGPPNPAMQQPYPGMDTSQNGQRNSGPELAQYPQESSMGNATSLDDLISGAAKAAEVAAENSPPKAEEVPEEKTAKKEKAKEKSKATRLVYADEEISPEEKMARLPRYAFVPDGKEETVLGDATTAAVTGVVTGSDDVVDVQG